MKTLRLLLRALLVATTAIGCSASPADSGESDDALTSVTARARDLKFTGVVYVDRGASNSTILSAVRSQTQTAFGALRTAQVGVNSRELKDVDPRTFVKEDVVAVDTSKTGTVSGTTMTRVRYTYTDRAILPISMARRSALSIAVMGSSYQSQTDRILTECTANDAEAKEFQDSIWYMFDPSLSSCKAAMTTEQKAIDTAKKTLATTQVSLLEVNRLYLPITVKLGADVTNKGTTYPEYGRLFAGGVQKGKIVVGLLNGFIDHGAHNDNTDSGYGEWIDEVRASMQGHDFKLVKSEPSEDFSTYTIGTKKLTGLSFQSILDAEDGTFPSDITSYADQTEFKKQAGAKVIKHWLTLEADTKVTIGTAAPQNLGIQVYTYFGVEEDSEPYHQAIKNSDVFIYNGHSYIGYGPLDPSNFSASDFPASYQLMFIDGCVSYNYYDKDYFPLKTGGTKNLEVISNGVEAPSYHSGLALGLFVSMLVDGKQHSYRDLLVAAQETDPLRVVDGEVDNTYSPTKTPIKFQ